MRGLILFATLAGCGRTLEHLKIVSCDPDIGCFTFNLPRSAVTVSHTLVINLTSDSRDNYTWTSDVGRFDMPGIFVAPDQPGTAHITATLISNPGFFANVAIDVVPELATPVVVPDRNPLSSTTAGYHAHLQSTDGVDTELWQIGNGILTSSPTEREVTFTTGGVGSVVLQVVVTNRAGDAPPPGGINIPVVPAATADFDIDVPAFITEGKGRVDVWVKSPTPGLTYVWTISQNGTSTELPDHGDHVSFAAGTVGDITVSCRATNSAGDTAPDAVEKTAALVPPGVFVIAGAVGGAGTRDGPSGINRVYNVIDMVSGASGEVYFIDGNALRVAYPDSRVVTLAGDALVAGTGDGDGASARFSSPYALGRLGNQIYVADQEDSSAALLRRVTVGSPSTVTTVWRDDAPACTASTPGFVGHMAGSGNVLYTAAGDSALYNGEADTVFSITPVGATGVVFNRISGNCSTHDFVSAATGAISTAKFGSLIGLTLIDNHLFAMDDVDGYSDYAAIRITLPSGPVEQLGPFLPDYPTDFVMLDSDHFISSYGYSSGGVTTDQSCVIGFEVSTISATRLVGGGQEGTLCASGFAAGTPLEAINQMTLRTDGSVLISTGDGPPNFDVPAQLVSMHDFSMVTDSAKISPLAGTPAQYSADAGNVAATARDVRMALGTLGFAVNDRDEVFVAQYDGVQPNPGEAIFSLSAPDASAVTHIVSLSVAGGGSVEDGPVELAPFYDISAIAFDAQGQLLVADGGTGKSRLRRLTPDNYVDTLASLDTSDTIWSIATDPRTDADIYFTTEDRLYRLRPDGRLEIPLDTFSGAFTDSSGNDPGGGGGFRASTRQGTHIFMLDAQHRAIRVFDTQAHTLRTVLNNSQIGAPGGVDCVRQTFTNTPCANACLWQNDFDEYPLLIPDPIAVLPDGSLVIGDVSQIHKVTDPLGPTCSVTTIMGDLQRGVVVGANDLKLNYVVGLAVTRSGDLAMRDRNEPALFLVRTP